MQNLLSLVHIYLAQKLVKIVSSQCAEKRLCSQKLEAAQKRSVNAQMVLIYLTRIWRKQVWLLWSYLLSVQQMIIAKTLWIHISCSLVSSQAPRVNPSGRRVQVRAFNKCIQCIFFIRATKTKTMWIFLVCRRLHSRLYIYIVYIYIYLFEYMYIVFLNGRYLFEYIAKYFLFDIVVLKSVWKQNKPA